jgi:phospholipid/cholesterol/gamma-HCH transport system substrate-binding protein
MKLSDEARIGIAVVGAALILFSGVVFLRGVDLRGTAYSLTILYRNVNGLQEGSVISVAGLTIGSVQSMKLSGTTIAVNASVQAKIHLPKDSRATLKSASIMGGKFIEITPGVESTMLQDGDTLVGTSEADLGELTASLSPISANMLGLLENVNSTFDEKTRTNIKNIIADVNRSSAELQNIIHSEGQHLNSAIGNFERFSSSFSRFAVELDTITRSQRSNIDSSMVNIRRATHDFQTTTQSLNAVLGKMKKGEGTLGRLVNDERLYDHLDSLTVNLTMLIRDLRENPGRYVKFSVF